MHDYDGSFSPFLSSSPFFFSNCGRYLTAAALSSFFSACSSSFSPPFSVLLSFSPSAYPAPSLLCSALILSPSLLPSLHLSSLLLSYLSPLAIGGKILNLTFLDRD